MTPGCAISLHSISSYVPCARCCSRHSGTATTTTRISCPEGSGSRGKMDGNERPVCCLGCVRHVKSEELVRDAILDGMLSVSFTRGTTREPSTEEKKVCTHSAVFQAAGGAGPRAPGWHSSVISRAARRLGERSSEGSEARPCWAAGGGLLAAGSSPGRTARTEGLPVSQGTSG